MVVTAICTAIVAIAAVAPRSTSLVAFDMQASVAACPFNDGALAVYRTARVARVRRRRSRRHIAATTTSAVGLYEIYRLSLLTFMSCGCVAQCLNDGLGQTLRGRIARCRRGRRLAAPTCCPAPQTRPTSASKRGLTSSRIGPSPPSFVDGARRQRVRVRQPTPRVARLLHAPRPPCSVAARRRAVWQIDGSSAYPQRLTWSFGSTCIYMPTSHGSHCSALPWNF